MGLEHIDSLQQLTPSAAKECVENISRLTNISNFVLSEIVSPNFTLTNSNIHNQTQYVISPQKSVSWTDMVKSTRSQSHSTISKK